MKLPNVTPELLSTNRPALHAVILALGETRAREWLQYYGGGWVYVPNRDDALAYLRLSLTGSEAGRLIDALEPLLSDHRYVLIPSRITQQAEIREIDVTFPEVEQSLLDSLPPILRAIVKALGYARASEWLQDHGGVNIHIPLHKQKALGLDSDELARLKLVLQPHLDSNNRLSCPKADKLLAKARNACIINNAHRESIAVQARMYKLSSRQITNIRGEAGNYQQVDLFGDMQ